MALHPAFSAHILCPRHLRSPCSNLNQCLLLCKCGNDDARKPVVCIESKQDCTALHPPASAWLCVTKGSWSWHLRGQHRAPGACGSKRESTGSDKPHGDIAEISYRSCVMTPLFTPRPLCTQELPSRADARLDHPANPPGLMIPPCPGPRKQLAAAPSASAFQVGASRGLGQFGSEDRCKPRCRT